MLCSDPVSCYKSGWTHLPYHAPLSFAVGKQAQIYGFPKWNGKPKGACYTNISSPVLFPTIGIDTLLKLKAVSHRVVLRRYGHFLFVSDNAATWFLIHYQLINHHHNFCCCLWYIPSVLTWQSNCLKKQRVLSNVIFFNHSGSRHRENCKNSLSGTWGNNLR